MPLPRIFDLSQLDEVSRPVIERALGRVRVIDLDAGIAELRRAYGRETVPVRASDLSRHAAALSAGDGHAHVHDEEGNTAHLLGGPLGDTRRAVLGLYWLRPPAIEVERRLMTTNPTLAEEVTLSEVAHLFDYLIAKPVPGARRRLFAAMHPGMPDAELEAHGHDWFDDEGPGDPNVVDRDYFRWGGEALMGAFVRATTDLPLALDAFAHPATPEVVAGVRAIMVELAPLPAPTPAGPSPEVYATGTGKVFHRGHSGIRRTRTFATAAAASASGLRACRICRPT